MYADYSNLGYDFYSHTPHGVQHSRKRFLPSCNEFLLTHPSRGATSCGCFYFSDACISTHTPLTGCNYTVICGRMFISNFYSHTPHGVQLRPSMDFHDVIIISTHTPLTGCNAVWILVN